MDHVTILVTGAGAPGTVGTIEALKELPVRYRLVGTDIDAQAGTRFLFDAFYQVPLPERPEFVEVLQTVVKHEGVSLVLPQVTRELPVLAANKQQFAESGCRILVNDVPTIAVLNNKYALMQRMMELGLPVPDHQLVRAPDELREAVLRLGYPARRVVVKPPVSNGMRGLRILREPTDPVTDFLSKKPESAECSLDDLLGIFRGGRMPELLVCEFLPGLEVSVDCLCRRGLPVIILPRTRERVKAGITFAGRSVEDVGVTEQCAKVIGALELDHVVGFQFRYSEQGIPLIVECNPRIQGTMAMGLYCGANVIAGAICDALGLPTGLGQGSVQWGVCLSRYWGGIAHKDSTLIGRF